MTNSKKVAPTAEVIAQVLAYLANDPEQQGWIFKVTPNEMLTTPAKSGSGNFSVQKAFAGKALASPDGYENDTFGIAWSWENRGFYAWCKEYIKPNTFGEPKKKTKSGKKDPKNMTKAELLAFALEQLPK